MSIKFQFGEEIRCLDFMECENYNVLSFTVRKIFKIDSDITLFWFDDEGDQITLSSASEYSSALKVMSSMNKRNGKAIKFFVGTLCKLETCRSTCFEGLCVA